MSRARAVPARRLLHVLLAGSMSVACTSRSAGPDQEELARRINEREGYTADQARCLSRRIAGSFRPDEVRLLHEEGIMALPESRWSAYVRFVAGCVLREELAVDDGAAGQGAPGTGGPGS